MSGRQVRRNHRPFFARLLGPVRSRLQLSSGELVAETGALRSRQAVRNGEYGSVWEGTMFARVGSTPEGGARRG